MTTKTVELLLFNTVKKICFLTKICKKKQNKSEPFKVVHIFFFFEVYPNFFLSKLSFCINFFLLVGWQSVIVVETLKMVKQFSWQINY